ncbi:MAG: TatD family hydrolase, partial [Deltaproteobacteria bacterium]|nr:TatD family hydrolase [Deltaproteobacteria bacterium]
GAENLDETIEIAERFNLFFALGVHPHDASLGVSDYQRYNSKIESIFKRIKTAALNPKMVAIGEIGLDFYYNHSPRDVQKRTFSEFLGFASENNMPVIIHSRNAFLETIDMIKPVRQRLTKSGVFHCFSGDREQAKKVLDMGFYVSIPGIVTFRKAQEMQEVTRYLPEDRILIETDAPFLAPVPYRGKRNEPAFIPETYKFIAELRGVSIERISGMVLKNALSCFKIRKEDIIDTD